VDDLDAYIAMIRTFFSHEGVAAAKLRAQIAGVTLVQILTAILPFVLQALQTGTTNWSQVIAAILALIHPPTPSPTLS
jgi:hypothetical protein